MARVSIILCLVILVTLGVVISVSFANKIEQHLESSDKNIEHHNIKHKEKRVQKVDGEKEEKKEHVVHKKGEQHDPIKDDHNDVKKHSDKKKSSGHDNQKEYVDGKENEHDDDDGVNGDDDTDDDTDDDDDKDEVDGDDDEKDDIRIYELKKGNLTIKFTNWGASIMSLEFPDKNGKIEDIVLGYNNIKSYKTDSVYFGATVGRVANRIGKAQFKLNGNEYKTNANDGKNTLHGFPGELNITVTYKIDKENELSVVMEAKPKDKATPVNLAHHSYWNLGGHTAGDILSQEIQILGSNYTPVDAELIPTGNISPVKGTPYDFVQLCPIKDNMRDLKTGYDINYCLDGKADQMRKVVEVVDKKSGRNMELFGNQPGLQFYTGGMLKDIEGKNGAVYKAFAGLCLETQRYPDAVNHPEFPSQLVEPGKKIQTYYAL